MVVRKDLPLKERFAALLGRGWKLDSLASLRCRKGYCPILALADHELMDDRTSGYPEYEFVSEMPQYDVGDGDKVVFSNASYGFMAMKLGIDTQKADAVATAADTMATPITDYDEVVEALLPLFQEAGAGALLDYAPLPERPRDGEPTSVE